jgi:hypothetical protein
MTGHIKLTAAAPRRLICLLSLLFGLLRSSYGMDFSLNYVNPLDGKPYSNGNYDLLMKGEIVPGDYERLLAFATTSKIPLLRVGYTLSSPGGDVSEALRIGRLFKNIYASVVVGPESGPCASACFIIFASAVFRQAEDGLVGIHRPYVSPNRLASVSPSAAEALETRALLDAETYLHQLRVPNRLVDEMFENASTEIHWLSYSELSELGRRPPWYEEFLIARCGLDKAAEERFIEDPENNKALLSGIMSAFRCGLDLTLPEATKNLKKALQDYMFAVLRQSVPQWERINKSSEFRTWLLDTSYNTAGVIVGAGKPQLLRDAWAENDAARVVTIFKEYVAACGASGESCPLPPHGDAPPGPSAEAAAVHQYSVNDIVVGRCYEGGLHDFHVVEIANRMVTYVDHDSIAELIHRPSTKRSSIGIEQFARQLTGNCTDLH